MTVQFLVFFCFDQLKIFESVVMRILIPVMDDVSFRDRFSRLFPPHEMMFVDVTSSILLSRIVQRNYEKVWTVPHRVVEHPTPGTNATLSHELTRTALSSRRGIRTPTIRVNSSANCQLFDPGMKLDCGKEFVSHVFIESECRPTEHPQTWWTARDSNPDLTA